MSVFLSRWQQTIICAKKNSISTWMAQRAMRNFEFTRNFWIEKISDIVVIRSFFFTDLLWNYGKRHLFMATILGLRQDVNWLLLLKWEWIMLFLTYWWLWCFMHTRNCVSCPTRFWQILISKSGKKCLVLTFEMICKKLNFIDFWIYVPKISEN